MAENTGNNNSTAADTVSSMVKSAGASKAGKALLGKAAGPYGTLAVSAWENRKTVFAILCALLFLLMLPVLFILMLPSLIFGGLTNSGNASQPIINDNTTIVQSTKDIAFAVNQEQRLDIQGMNLPTDGQSGMPLPLSFQYINKGKSTIYNFSVAIEGDFTLDGGDTYIGNLSAGYNDYFDGSLIPNGEGELKGAVVLKYEDSQGQEKEERTEFTANIMPMDMGVFEPGIDSGMMPGMPGMPEAKAGFPLWGWIVIGVVVLGGAGTGVFLFLKKRKANKKAAVNDEED